VAAAVAAVRAISADKRDTSRANALTIRNLAVDLVALVAETVDVANAEKRDTLRVNVPTFLVTDSEVDSEADAVVTEEAVAEAFGLARWADQGRAGLMRPMIRSNHIPFATHVRHL